MTRKQSLNNERKKAQENHYINMLQVKQKKK